MDFSFSETETAPIMEDDKGGIYMKNFVKLTAVGVAGYLIGFYEMKYKSYKALLIALLEKRDAQE